MGDWSQMKKLKPPLLQIVYVWHEMSNFFHLRFKIISLYLGEVRRFQESVGYDDTSTLSLQFYLKDNICLFVFETN